MADILIAPASTMPNAPTGQVTLFLDTENNNILSYIDDQGNVSIYSTGSASALEECCSCDIAKKWMDAITCGLKSGMLTADEFGNLTNTGLSVTTNETTDPDTGAKTCTVEIGPKVVVPSPQSIELGVFNHDAAPLGTVQILKSVLPAEASQAVNYTSSDPAVATVSSTGLITAVAAGSCIITVSSEVNPAVYVTFIFTVA